VVLRSASFTLSAAPPLLGQLSPSGRQEFAAGITAGQGIRGLLPPPPSTTPPSSRGARPTLAANAPPAGQSAAAGRHSALVS